MNAKNYGEYNKYSERGKRNIEEFDFRECKCCKKILHNSKFPIDKKPNSKHYLSWTCKSCRNNKISEQRGHNKNDISIDAYASSIYRSIVNRTTIPKSKRRKSYKDATLNNVWKKNKDCFVNWYKDNHYECGEKLHVDKDLLFYNNKEYSPDTCILLPESLNKRLSNYRKHSPKNSNKYELPLGVYFDKNRNKYYGVISLHGTNKNQKLNYWDTPEEAFEEYRILKKQDLINLANEYKDKIPDKAYQALLARDIYPY